MEPEGRIVAKAAAGAETDLVELARLAYNNTVLVPDGMAPGLQATFMYRFTGCTVSGVVVMMTSPSPPGCAERD